MPRTGLVIAGLTGAGKSRVAMQVARQRAAEIINTDSVQLYRGMDVGSAKPTPADRAAVRHHLVDVADVAAPWTVVEVADAARDALLDVASRPDAGAPLLVGGAGYYLEALLHYAEAPRTPASTRGGRAVGPGGGLGGSARPGGWDAALSALAERDPEYARSLSRNDWQRLERAAEVLAAIAPGQTLRDCLPPKKARYYGPDATPLRLVPTFLTRSDADGHKRALDARCEKMLVDGLLVETLRLRRGWPRDAAPARAIGYRQALQFLDAPRARWRCDDALVALVQELQVATRRYANKQRSWFRHKMPEFVWLDLDALPDEEAPRALVRLLDLDDAAVAAIAAAPDSAHLRQASGKDMRRPCDPKLTMLADRAVRFEVLEQLARAADEMDRFGDV